MSPTRMPHIHPYRPNIFAGSPLDRLDSHRKNADWIGRELADPRSAFVPVWRGNNLIDADMSVPALRLLAAADVQDMLASTPWAMLGVSNGQTMFALDVSSRDSPPAPEGSRYEDLRRIGGLLAPHDAAILAHARGLMHWRTRHRFCGVCGAACNAQDAGHVMACTGCRAHHFPRTDPAVIMLVTHEDRALLGQPARFRNMRVFTTLAGFVEPGESLEEAVAREVWEEAGIRVAQVRYQSSQPWPFPASIMLGFSAEAVTADITVDTSELVEARWFTKAEVRACDGFVLPPDMSIARRLIEGWVGA